MAQQSKGAVGIVVGGGPAPGINGVISAAAIEANARGHEAVGIMDGFKWLAKGNVDHVMPLTAANVSRIHFMGGSILRTSRENPTKDKEKMANTVAALRKLNIRYLVTIGGDDTAFTASTVAKEAGGKIRVVHVPKTIDNDLPLPGNQPTFGYHTARHVGVGLVQNLMEDSRTTNRWYLVVAMGRHAGHLSLGIGKAAAATLTLIAEEFEEEPVSLKHVCDILEGAILKRRTMGRDDGVAVIAEGLIEKLNTEELKKIPGIEIEYDPHGNLRLGEVDLGKILKDEIARRCEERDEKITIVHKNIGYELRSTAPIPFDCEYVRDLGYGAIKFVFSDAADGPDKGAMVCIYDGKLTPLYFKDILDKKTGKTKVRFVDLNTESYEVARRYMIRLDSEDFEDPTQLQRLASAAGTTPDAFRERFGYLIEG